MKKLFFLILMGSSLTMYAQEPEDGLRLSWFAPNGTARSNALGGAMGSLGGDLSSNHINPAGLGFYKSSELLLTPKFLVQTNNFNYRGTSSSNTNSKSNFKVGLLIILIPWKSCLTRPHSPCNLSLSGNPASSKFK